MIDAEIYVDRNAESAIQSMNSYLESLRTSLLEEADADPEDLWMRTLKAGQIDEDEYFCMAHQKKKLSKSYAAALGFNMKTLQTRNLPILSKYSNLPRT